VIKAVIFVQADRLHTHASRCLDYCATKRYEVAGLIRGDRAAAERMIRDGLAEIVVLPVLTAADAAAFPHVEVPPRRPAARRGTARRTAGYGPRLAAR
jgi:hypothetical protein